MFSTNAKRLLKNYIRHTDTHNRIVEENDMWRQYEKMKGTEKNEYRSKSRESFLDDNREDMNDSRYSTKSRSAHMDQSKDSSTYWQRQLQKTEEADPDRWGHSGYKELYPNEFDSERSDTDSSSSSSTSTSSEEERKRRKRKKKKKEKKKRERLEEGKHKKKEKVLKKDNSENGGSSKKHKKKKKSDKKTSKRSTYSDSSDSEDSSSGSRAKKLKVMSKSVPKPEKVTRKKSKHKVKRKVYYDNH